MGSFVDNEGRRWRVEATPDGLRRAREQLGVNLVALAREPGLAGLGALLSDVPRVVDVVYLLCRDQADAAGIDDEAFGRRLYDENGDIVVSAGIALAEAVADFIADRRAKAAIGRVSAGRGLAEAVADFIADRRMKAVARLIRRHRGPSR